MIDLTILSDPRWLAQREMVWKEKEKEFKLLFRKDRLGIVRDYFMSGVLPENDKLGDEAKFYWFPLQNAQSWDFLFEHVVQDPKVYEKIFYSQFGDLSDRALSREHELDLWDYFVGDTFRPVVTTRVTIGNESNFHSFNVEPVNVISDLLLYLEGVLGDQKSEYPKWMRRIDYFLTALPYVGDEAFRRRNKNARYNARVGNVVANLFVFMVKPAFLETVEFTLKQTENRLEYLRGLREKMDGVEMSPAMKQLWEETKQKYGAE